MDKGIATGMLNPRAMEPYGISLRVASASFIILLN
jgi:hypothetical protein